MGEEALVSPDHMTALEYALREGWATLAVLILFVGVLTYLLREHRSEREAAMKARTETSVEVSRKHSEATKLNALALDRVGRGLTRMAIQNSAMIEVIKAQPAAYALQKLKLANGGFTEEEEQGLRDTVRTASEKADALTSTHCAPGDLSVLGLEDTLSDPGTDPND